MQHSFSHHQPRALHARVRFANGILEFEEPVDWLTSSDESSVVRTLQQVEQAVAKGLCAVGFVTFEASSAFDSAFPSLPSAPGLPLIGFGLYRRTTFASPSQQANTAPVELSVVEGEGLTEQHRYISALGDIHRAIGAGDVYQVNYTFPFMVDALRREQSKQLPSTLCTALNGAQGGRYGAVLRAGELEILSASPELFFELDRGVVTTRPMKGTAPRGRFGAEDTALAETLRSSIKDQAENVMIVDMMRNDLGRIAEVGSVRVPALFDVERLPTLHQMTSTVTARTSASLSEVFGALFPCASITGAPKGSALSAIAELEAGPRGVYTGAVGMVLPCHPSRLEANDPAEHELYARFNVAIRTAWRTDSRMPFHYGVGSGVVWDSDAHQEHAECRSKALAITTPRPHFALLETMLVRGTASVSLENRTWSDRVWLLSEHMERLQRTAAYFDFRLDLDRVAEAVRLAIGSVEERSRLRLLVEDDGAVRTEIKPEPRKRRTSAKLAISSAPVESKDPFLFHKTTHRRVYQEHLDLAERTADLFNHRIDDVLLWNESGELTETTIANIAVEPAQAGEPWLTPPREAGLLAGTLRAHLLRRGWLREATIKLEELTPERQLVLLNSVRGLYPAKLVDRTNEG